MNLRCLVTGGAGFIGSHLVERLLGDGHSVTVVDNFATGREENLHGASNRGELHIEAFDVQDVQRMQQVMKGIDWVFHLAGLADIVPSIQRPLDYHSANVDGTASAVEAARQGGVKRFIYVASSTCYGLPEVFPTPESAPIRPMFPYALSKYMGEEIVLNWHRIYGLPAVSLRLFNVFGPRSRTTGTYGAVFGVFLAQKLAGKPFTVVGDGRQTRDFTFVTDVVDVMVRAAQSHVVGETFNVGSGGTYSINSLVQRLGGEIAYVPRRPGEPDCTFADITKVRQILLWEPRVRFAQGIDIMLDHIELWRNAPVWDPESVEEATRDWFKYLGR